MLKNAKTPSKAPQIFVVTKSVEKSKTLKFNRTFEVKSPAGHLNLLSAP